MKVFEHKPTIDPRTSIVPIVELDSNRDIVKLLGTGFFVGPKELPVIVSAKHVFTENPLPPHNSHGLICYGNGKKTAAKVLSIKYCEKFDIVAFHSSIYLTNVHPLKLSEEITPSNEDVITYEYSPSRMIDTGEGKQKILIDAFTHKGNILRHYDSDFPENIPTKSFDTSYPALQGASGAPVIRVKDFTVAGMLVANHERHLIPAQVVRIQENKNEFEETKYFMPTGKAINSSLIIDFLKSIHISLE